jgi:polyhydroxyalkanoate synthesis regulator phasin
MMMSDELHMGLRHIVALLKREGYKGASEIVANADQRIKEYEGDRGFFQKRDMEQCREISRNHIKIKELEAKFIKHKVAYRNYIMRGDRIKELEKQLAKVRNKGTGSATEKTSE